MAMGPTRDANGRGETSKEQWNPNQMHPNHLIENELLSTKQTTE
jgi:hypothetical protein